jgi:hypothetical protein
VAAVVWTVLVVKTVEVLAEPPKKQEHALLILELWAKPLAEGQALEMATESGVVAARFTNTVVDEVSISVEVDVRYWVDVLVLVHWIPTVWVVVPMTDVTVGATGVEMTVV